MRHFILSLALIIAAAGQSRAREAAVAGQFYPADPAVLADVVDQYLAAGRGIKPVGSIAAVLVPHAGYEYSGRLAGLAYARVAGSYDTVVILAAGHTEGVKGAALLAADFYRTPLGKVLPDRELAAALVKASPLFEDRASAHLREHAVEVQLPFLQRRLKKPFRLLAAVLNTKDLGALKTIGSVLGASLKGKKVLLVISTDFSHYPGAAAAASADGAMLLAIKSMDPELVWNTSRFLLNKNIPGLETCACGEAALEAGMEAARVLGARSFYPLEISESSAEKPGTARDRVVGYISGLFIKSGKPAPELSARQKAALLKEARLALENHFSGKDKPAGLEADPRLNLPAAVFVTLTKGGALRGCVGTAVPSMTLADAVRYGAVAAAFRDGRFRKLERAELDSVKIEISLLSPLKLARQEDFKPGVHGAVVVKEGKSGLFLPQVWEQIKDKQDFMGELCEQKAGLPRDCWKDPKALLYSFTADSFED